jgi:CarD family transcriptional regulator
MSTLFEVGEKIVHPMHGAGLIKKIEEKEILGKKKKYYELDLVLTKLDRVLIPVESTLEVGLRKVVDPERVSEILEVLQDETVELKEKVTNWSAAYQKNLLELKTGDVIKIAQVYKTLYVRNRKKKLSSRDSDLMERARKLIVSEIILANNVGEDKAFTMVDDALDILNDLLGEENGVGGNNKNH